MNFTSELATCRHFFPKVIYYMFRILSTRAFVKDIVHIKVISTKTTISMLQLKAENLNHRWVPSLSQHGISGIDVPSTATCQWLTTSTWTVAVFSLGWQVGPHKASLMICRFPICLSSPICVLPIADLIFHLSTIACDYIFVWFQIRKSFSLV